ncbi:zinc-binding dehydrogenase [Arthrobacter sp. 4R501]|uniref:zinc-binding dehydrogenase n=1 Tax=Arthrobacter sp. 4R501 TaxID=2058886 RepID=UPI001CA5EF1D|nr:zinc-binding dehydrogenase [Arthrobacter sp. 4R501]
MAIHAVARAGSLAGKDVLVNGAGPIGALLVAAARRAGAASVIASDLSETSLAIAKRMRADGVVLVGSGAQLPEADVAFEAAGAARVLGGVLAAVRRGGVVVQVGNLPAGPVTAELAALVFREVDYRGGPSASRTNWMRPSRTWRMGWTLSRC